MSFPTLDTLAKKLGVTRSALENDPMMFYDPVKGPVASRLRGLGEVGNPCENATMADLIAMKADATLDYYDQLRNAKRPEFPCKLEELLRYAANEPVAAWGAINAAFKGFLQISSPYKETEEIRNDLINEVNNRNGLLAILNRHSEGGEAHDTLMELIDDSDHHISSFKEVINYRETFSPSGTCPHSIEIEATDFHEGYMNLEEQTYNILINHLYRFNFYSFWKKHGKDYLALDNAKEKIKKKVSGTNRKSGHKGALMAGSKTWKEHTRELLSFCNKRAIPNTTEERLSFLQEFAAVRSANTKTQAKIRAFFGTLGNYLEDHPTEATLQNIIGLLRKEKILNASAGTIRGRLKVLRVFKERGGKPPTLAIKNAQKRPRATKQKRA